MKEAAGEWYNTINSFFSFHFFSIRKGNEPQKNRKGADRLRKTE